MLTRYLARLLGLWAFLVIGAMVADRPATIAATNALFTDPALMWVTGVFTTLIGLAIVLAHNRWSGGAVSVIVTVFGWAALIKGFLFVALPPQAQTAFYQSLHFERYFYGYFVVALALGGILIYGGFADRPTADRPARKGS